MPINSLPIPLFAMLSKLLSTNYREVYIKFMLVLLLFIHFFMETIGAFTLS